MPALRTAQTKTRHIARLVGARDGQTGPNARQRRGFGPSRSRPARLRRDHSPTDVESHSSLSQRPDYPPSTGSFDRAAEFAAQSRVQRGYKDLRPTVGPRIEGYESLVGTAPSQMARTPTRSGTGSPAGMAKATTPSLELLGTLMRMRASQPARPPSPGSGGPYG